MIRYIEGGRAAIHFLITKYVIKEKGFVVSVITVKTRTNLIKIILGVPIILNNK
jgi:hypothetical protein